MAELKTQGGAEVVINSASFKEAMDLKNAITKELSKTDFNFAKLDLKKDISALSSIIFAIDCSSDIYKAVFQCLGRCLYNGQKITEATFEPESAREDYYEVAIECIKVNLAPFFRGLTSRLKTIELPKVEESPK